MNSNIIYKEIKPTYLYVKEHTITGLRYLGKTTRNDPYKYNGSGTDWVEHINEYGKEHIKTIWVSKIFTDTRIKDFAILASKHWNIVNSKDWANQKIENGMDGFTSKQSSDIQKRLLEEGKHIFQNTESQRNNQLKKVDDGTHHFLNTDMQKNNAIKRVEEGTHNFLDGENSSAIQNKRVEEGTHHFLSGDIQKRYAIKRVEEGTHHLQGGDIQRKNNKKRLDDGTHHLLGKKESPVWSEVRQLYRTLCKKIPNGTWQKLDKELTIIRDELLLQIEQNPQ